jgi:conjugal transfer pilus assembly protein TraW
MFYFKRRRVVLFASLWVIVASLSAFAQDLGQHGPVYSIAEPDLLVSIASTLAAKQKSGELARLSAQMQARAIQSVKSPPPVPGLTATVTAAVRYFDPSIEVAEDIKDSHGRLIAPAGKRVNPLDVISMTRQLLFFDGRDPRQVRFAKALVDSKGAAIIPVFYDQQGALTSRLGILHVPAIVSQEGRRLRIDEVLVP